jgi:hypothetical protein
MNRSGNLGIALYRRAQLTHIEERDVCCRGKAASGNAPDACRDACLESPRRAGSGRCGPAPRNVVAVGRVVLTNREHIIALEPMEKGLMGTLLRYPYEVRPEAEYFDDIEDVKLTKDRLDLARHIVNSKSAHFEPEKFEDHYEAALIDLINKKRAGQPITAKARPAARNVVNLMDALRASIGEAQASKPAKNAKRPPSDRRRCCCRSTARNRRRKGPPRRPHQSRSARQPSQQSPIRPKNRPVWASFRRSASGQLARFAKRKWRQPSGGRRESGA